MLSTRFRHNSLLILALIMLVCAGIALAESPLPKVEISLEGAPSGHSDALLNGLSIVKQQSSARLSERLINRLHSQAPAELRVMLEAFGYYHAHIDASLKQQDALWIAHYVIDLGDAVTVEHLSVNITGAAQADPAFVRLLENFPIRLGDSFSHADYESAKRDIVRLAAERGYFDGELTQHVVNVDLEENSASIYLQYDSGQRYYFAKPQFAKTVVGEALLERLTPFAVGDPYEASKVLALRNSLNNSGYFDVSSVQVLTDERANGEVDLAIELEPTAKHRYTAGIGYGTDTGARLGLGWENRYVNQRGHRLSADARLSQVTNRIGSEYLMPFWSERISAVGFTSELKQQKTDTSESRAVALGSFYTTTRFGWNETGNIRLLNERFKIVDDTTTSTILIPGVTWSRTFADDTLYSRRGASLSVSVSGASESVLSDISFAQVIVRGKLIRSLGERGRFITRGTFGMTEVDDFERLPSSLRFFAGGDSSIRGFDFESLGPTDKNDEVIGGRYLAVGSVEYEHMFLQNWGAAVFTDFGNAYNRWKDPIEYSVGTGLRWRSPVGLIRVDFARGISADNKPFAFHIVIGPDF